ncbi:MAG TPA: late competence development ComFB family protein [Gemmatimonadaceae bacterium]|jgi:competence protein ComFB|nr:late competence development ComFB family protein [Gemmatimonadaceae bacterium]
MGVTNVAMEVAQREYQSLRETLPKFCGCDTCRGDVLIYALNRLAPHYVSTRQGEILTELSLASDQEKARLDVTLLDGFRKVAAAPRCGAKPTHL